MPVQDAAYGLIPVIQATNGDRRYLLILHQKGHWAFPKGHREAGETDLEAACREVREETGLVDYTIVPDIEFMEAYSFTDKGGIRVEKTVKYYIAKISVLSLLEVPEIQVQDLEVADFRWCAYDEALTLITFAANRQVLKDCEFYLQGL